MPERDPNPRGSRGLSAVGGLRAFYPAADDVIVDELPDGTTRLCFRRASGEVVAAAAVDGTARLEGLGGGTYAVEALDVGGERLAEDFATVGEHPGERPVHGFATSFQDDDLPEIVGWHRALRSTVVQVYDWMESYTAPLGPSTGWLDPSKRPVSFAALRALSSRLGELGAVAHAYAPIYAVGLAFASEHPEMLMYEAPGQPVRFLDQIILADPGNASWQQHFARTYGAAADAIGFGGFHVDTYGYPRVAEDASGNPIDLRGAYRSFLDSLRSARPADLISFNQVDGVPSAAVLPAGPGFRYCEVWPPNVRWRHLEGLLDRSSGRAGMLGQRPAGEVVRGSVACYPPVWGLDDRSEPVVGAARADALRTVLCTEAVATMLGASALLYGDRTAALCDPYYPKHARLTADEASTVLSWRRFALRTRDLFIEGEDTSWYEIGDENGAVSVEGSAGVSPEPVGRSLFSRVVHTGDRVCVGVLDLTGSERGSWSEPTTQGSASEVTVRVLLAHPERWTIDAAVLGRLDGRFQPLAAQVVAHRQGRALEVRVPLVDGWSVVRISPSSDTGA